MTDLHPEHPDDVDTLRDLHLAAFAPSRAEADLVAALRGAGDHVPDLCLTARRHGEICGHTVFSRARVGDHAVLALAPMAVAPDAQRSGVGSALVTEALRRARETAFPLVVVLGHPEYYPRFGFEPARPLGIEAPFPVPDEAWMVCRLPAYSDAVHGTVVYSSAFDAVS